MELKDQPERDVVGQTRRSLLRGFAGLLSLSPSLPAMAARLPGAASESFPTIREFAGGASDVFANAYIIEGAGGVVVVDSLLTRTASRHLRRQVDSIGKPLQAIVLTHGHPDHYGGVAQLVEGLPDVPVIAIEGVDAVIRRDDAMKGAQLGKFGIDWAEIRVFPSRIATPGEPLAFDGFTLTPIDLGEGESDHDSIWILRGPAGEHAFIGDLVMDGVHAYTADAHTHKWVASLRRLQGMFADGQRLYPGHGEPGGIEMLADQLAYLHLFRSLVSDLAGGRSSLPDEETDRLVRGMVAFLGHDRMARWVEEGADPVAQELAAVTAP